MALNYINIEYHFNWQPGDAAVAWLTNKKYDKIKILKSNQKALHGDIEALSNSISLFPKNYFPVEIDPSDSDDDDYNDESGELDITSFLKRQDTQYMGLAYLVRTSGSSEERPQKMWRPLSALRPLRPCHRHIFVMVPTKVSFTTKPPGRAHHKRNLLPMDPLLPLNIKPDYCQRPELNNKLDDAQSAPASEEFKDYILKGKNILFYNCDDALNNDHNIIKSRETLDYYLQTEVPDKLDLLITDVLTEENIEVYLNQCWLYERSRASDEGEARGGSAAAAEAGLTCSVCGLGDDGAELLECPRCPAAYHQHCRKPWLIRRVQGKSHPRLAPYSAEQWGAGGVRGARPRRVTPCPPCAWGAAPGESVWNIRVFPFTYSRLLLGEDSQEESH